VSGETWVGRGRADLRYAHRSAREGRKEKACGQLSVAGELDESLVGVVGSHVGGGFGAEVAQRSKSCSGVQ
jgi:hypothetical protein